MTDVEKPKKRKSAPYKSDLHEARPLLQAIFLGILLATGLVAAAAMAKPDERAGAQNPQRPAAEKLLSPPGATRGPHQPY